MVLRSSRQQQQQQHQPPNELQQAVLELRCLTSCTTAIIYVHNGLRLVPKQPSPFMAEEDKPMVDEVPKPSSFMVEGDKPMELKDNVAEVPKQSSFMAKEDKRRGRKDNIAEIAALDPSEKKRRKLAADDSVDNLAQKATHVPKQSSVMAEEDKPMVLKDDVAEIDAFEPATKKRKFAAVDESVAQKTERGKNVDWSNLPPELLILLAQTLSSVKDFVSFGSVCKGCMAATTLKDDDTHPVPPKLPCIMLAEKEGDEEMCGFFNLTTGKVCQIEVSDIAGRILFGSEWLCLDIKV